jgi:hypothetical protein
MYRCGGLQWWLRDEEDEDEIGLCDQVEIVYSSVRTSSSLTVDEVVRTP